MVAELSIKKLQNITNKEIEFFCTLKKQHWNYSLKEQKEWWHSNSKKTDQLIYFKIKNKIFAFLRLRKRKILLQNNIFQSRCITEVCVDKNYQNKGWGKKLIKETEKILEKNDVSGYLLCYNSQQNFYKSCGWKIKKNIELKSNLNSISKKIENDKSCFFYNLKNYKQKIILIGNVF